MTFETFEKIASIHRPDIIVSKHGDYCNNRSKNTLGIIFIKPDGKQSRVYNYHGTYTEILNKLNIQVITKSDVASLEAELKTYEYINGQESIFDDGMVFDYTKEIADTKDRLNYFLTSDDIVREWEY